MNKTRNKITSGRFASSITLSSVAPQFFPPTFNCTPTSELQQLFFLDSIGYCQLHAVVKGVTTFFCSLQKYSQNKKQLGQPTH